MDCARWAALVIGLILPTLPGVGAMAAGSRCEFDTFKAVGERAAADLACHQRGALKGRLADSACLDAAAATFEAQLGRAARAGDCRRTGDAQALAALIRDFAGEVVRTIGTTSQSSKCAAAKLGAAGKAARALALCNAKAVSRATAVDTACIDDTLDRLRESFAKAEAAHDCPHEGDAPAAAALARLFNGALTSPGELDETVRALAQLDAGQRPLCAQPEEGSAPAINVFEPNGARDLQIDQSLDDQVDYTVVSQSGEDKNYRPAQTRRATRRDILDNLSRLNREDIWIFFGHGVVSGGNVVGIGAIEEGKTKLVSRANIDRALRADNNPPGIAYLGGCVGAALLDTFVNASTGVAIGWDKTVTMAAASEALSTFWSELFSGETFGDARDEAHDIYREVLEAGLEAFRDLLEKADATRREIEESLKTAESLDATTLRDRFVTLREMNEANRAGAQQGLDGTKRQLADLPQLEIMAQAAIKNVAERTLGDVLP